MKTREKLIAVLALLPIVALLSFLVVRYLIPVKGAKIHRTNADEAPTYALDYRPLWGNQLQDTSHSYLLYRISAIKVDKQNNIYVVDGGNNRIMKYDSTGGYIQQIGRAGQGPGELLDPSDLDFDEEGYLYVTNKGNNRIEIYDPQGGYFDSFKVDPPFSSYRHASIAVGSHREIFVNLPTAGYLVTVFSRDGERLRQFGTIKRFETPSEIYIFNAGTMEFDHEAGALYFVFTARPEFQKYDSQGRLIVSRVVDGVEVRRAFEAWERNKKNARPGTISWMVFFYDVVLLPSRDLLASTEVGPTLYQFNAEGEVVKRFILSPAQEKFPFGMLAALGKDIVLSADIYSDRITVLERR